MDKDKKRHIRFFKFIHFVAARPISRYFGYEYDKLDYLDEPYLLLANHNCDLDPAFIGIAVKNQTYFVATENITRSKLGGWFLMRYFNPILHVKGKKGIKTVVEMRKRLSAGERVCLFAEGNRSFNGITGEIPAVTAKLAKKSGVKLITYRLEGGYYTEPRWGFGFRRGKVRGRLINIYTKEQLESLSEDEIGKRINEDLYENAEVTQEKLRVRYKTKQPALGLESLVYMCPECEKIGTLRSDKHKLACDCGYSISVDEYFNVVSSKGERISLLELDKEQKRKLFSRLDSERGIIFSDAIKAVEIDDNHKIIKEVSGNLKAYSDRVCFECEGNSFVLDKTSVKGLAIFSRNTLVCHIGDKERHFETKCEGHFNGLKYIYLYECMTGKE